MLQLQIAFSFFIVSEISAKYIQNIIYTMLLKNNYCTT